MSAFDERRVGGVSASRRTGGVELFVCCWTTYLTAYLCRVNFSRAMNALNTEYALSLDRLGTIGAVFFFVYACGQLVNGFLGDRMRPVPFLLIALTGTAACNFAVSLCRDETAILLLWGINGYFQSIFWSTIIRLLAMKISPDKRSLISSGISTAMPAGYLVSWCVLGNLFEGAPPSIYFAVPAAAALAAVALWLVIGRRAARGAASVDTPRASVLKSARFVADNGLLPLVPLCVLHGIVKEGVSFWAPQLIGEVFALDGAAGVWSIALLPLANFAGMMLSKPLLRRPPLRVIAGMTGCMALAALVMILFSVPPAYIAMLALLSCLSYGGNTVLMSFIPMQYTRSNMVATLVGLLDFSSYLGAAISTYALGRLLQSAGFAPLPYLWCGAAAAMLLIDCYAMRRCHIGEQTPAAG